VKVARRTRERLKDVARYITPMRPLRVPKLPADSSKWLYEPKLDGYRAIAVKNAGRPALYSMDGQIYDTKFPRVFDALSRVFHKDLVLDGELVALESSGRPNFNELQNHRHTQLPIFFVVFDIMHFKERDLLDRPLEERKKILAEVAEGFISPISADYGFSDDVELDTATQVVRQTRIEDLVAKRRGSVYLAGKEVDFWQKHRFNKEDKFFIGGYIAGPQGIGELLIGDGKFYFIKRLIAGLNKFNRREIYDGIRDLKTRTCPFVNLPERASEHQYAITPEVMAECVWTKPEQPCEVEFIERTPRRRLRHAEFRRLLPRSGEK
jgi:bifunctional non-homologous end joining protein LigD